MNPPKAQPTARLLTPTGRGAVATIVLQGEPEQLAQVDRFFSPVNGKSLARQVVQQLAFGHWGIQEPHEELLVCRTANGTAEIHCHGGTACVERVLTDLRTAGIEVATDENVTLHNELANAVTHAPTLKTAQCLLTQQRLWPEFADGLLRSDSCPEVAKRVRGVIQWAKFGLHLTEPWQVAIVGEPNVGKSTLLNALLGFDRSIVFDQPGTTRDVVSARTVFDGWPVLLSDTAGLRETDDAIERSGVQAAHARAESADLRLVVTDVRDSVSVKALAAGEPPIPGATAHPLTKPFLHVGNKADTIEQPAPAVDALVSATTGQGVDGLIERIATALVPAVPDDKQCVPISSDQLAWLNRIVKICEQDQLEPVKDLVRTRLA
jgi:tRNA modification GTPase